MEVEKKDLPEGVASFFNVLDENGEDDVDKLLSESFVDCSLCHKPCLKRTAHLHLLRRKEAPTSLVSGRNCDNFCCIIKLA